MDYIYYVRQGVYAGTPGWYVESNRPYWLEDFYYDLSEAEAAVLAYQNGFQVESAKVYKHLRMAIEAEELYGVLTFEEVEEVKTQYLRLAKLEAERIVEENKEDSIWDI